MKTHLFPTAVFGICLYLCLMPAQGSNPAESMPLEFGEASSFKNNHSEELAPNQTKTRWLKGGETHFYLVKADGGSCLRFVVEQNGIDVMIQILTTDGELLKEVDRPSGGIGRETVTFLPAASGVFQIKIVPWANYAPIGEYRIGYSSINAPLEEDSKRSLAEDLTSEAESLRNNRSRKSKKIADEKFKAALDLWRELGDRYEQAVICYGFGWLYHDLSRYTESAVWFARGRKEMRALGDEYGEIINTAGMGWAQSPLGEHRLAAYNFRQALVVLRRMNQETAVASAASGLGNVEYLLGNYEAANASLKESLRLHEKFGNKRGQALTLISLANVQLSQRRSWAALELLNRSLRLGREIKNNVVIAEALSIIGRAYNLVGQYAIAQKNFRESLEVNRELENPLGEAQILNGLCVAQTALGDFSSARESIENALRLIERIRNETAGFRLRRSFNSTVQDFYENYLHLLMLMHQREPEKGYDREALRASEFSRARSLLDLVERRSLMRENRIAPQLIEQSQNLQGEITFALLQYRQANRESEKSDLALLIQDVSARLWEVESEINNLAENSSKITPSLVLSAQEIQNVLDNNILLLEYALTDHNAYLWAITNKELKTFNLGSSETVRKKAQDFYKCVSVPAASKSEKGLCQSKNEELSAILLAPIAADLKNQRLAVVAQDELQLVPFAALINAKTNGYLIESHEIVNLPSASLLSFLRIQPQAPTNNKIALFADPVFDWDDARFVNQKITSRKEHAMRNFSAADKSKNPVSSAKPFPLRRLFGSRFEAERIEKSVRPVEVVKKMDFDAGRQAALGNSLSSFSVLHFATHTILDEDQTELAAIALSMLDKNKQPANGWLRSGEILNQDLHAELVFLSSCQSGIGKNIKGEGLMSLARSFFAAGAKRLIASQWIIEDKVAAEFAARFYHHYYQTTNRNAASAVRAAQIELKKDPRWKSSFYWAAFSLHGSW